MIVLAGCSLLFPSSQEEVASEGEIASSEGWLLAAQGQEEPAACEEDLSRSEARQEAKEALREEEEAQELKQVLASLGKRLMIWRAKGCEVSTEEEESGNDTSGQGLFSQQEGESETILVEVPAGADAALYLVETQGLDEGNYWVSLKETVEEGEVLTHIEVGLESDTGVQGLSADGDVGAVQFLLPNEEITQEIAEQVRELLEGSDTGTQGSGLWGMSAEEEWDWSRAEVVLLGNPAEGEEVEALLVIPAVDDETDGQALWGRTRPAIDPGRAVYARVRVQRLTQGGGGGRRYQVTSSRVQPRPGRELPPVFKYCPYRYYGKLVPFASELCQEAWESWYEKQWQRDEVVKKALLAHNLLVAEVGFYTAILSWDKQLGNNTVVLAGFDELDLSEFRSWMLAGANLPDDSTNVGLEPRIEEALRLLEEVGLSQLADWLHQLSRALANNRFDEVYESLLAQGFDKVEQAFLLVLDSTDPNDARSVARILAQELQESFLPPPEEYAAMAVWLAILLFQNPTALLAAGDNPEAAVANALTFLNNWAATYEKVWAVMSQMLGSEDLGHKVAQEFTNTVQRILKHIVETYRPTGGQTIREILGLPFSACVQIAFCRLFTGLNNYLQWMGQPLPDRLGRDVQRRVEIGWGTLQMLDNALTQGSSDDPFDQPWQLNGIVGCVNNAPNCADGTEVFDPAKHDNAFIIMRIKDQGTCLLSCGDIIIAARADHCQICGTSDKIDEILTWIKQAIAALQQQPQDWFGRDKLIVTYGFTNASAALTDAALQAIKEEFGESVIPILVWRLLPDGTVEYTCVGNCRGFTDDQLRAMACKEATGSANCDARPWGGSDPSSSQGSEQSTTVGGNPPPPPSSLCPPGQVCLQGVGDRR